MEPVICSALLLRSALWILLLSEEATAFSRDYSQLKKMIPGHFIALKWHYYDGTKNGKYISGKHR